MTSRVATRIWPAGTALVVCVLCGPIVVSASKGHRPEKDDKTRWGGNEAVIVVREKHFREIKGTIEAFQNEKLEGALVEVFDKPDYLVSSKPWTEKPEQRLLRNCVTSVDGKFCFRSLPSGTSEIRVSKDEGWNVTHVYVVVDRKAAERVEPFDVAIHVGT